MFVLFAVGLPNSPHKLIGSMKKISSKTNVEIELPVALLAETLSVSICDKQSADAATANPDIYNIAMSGLNVFKSRLFKEYKNSNNNLNNLASRVLTLSSATNQQTKTCLLPLKVSIDPEISEIFHTDFAEVSLGKESIFCANDRPFVMHGENFISVSDSINAYSKKIKDKKVIIELKNRLANAEKKKSRIPGSKKNQLLKQDQEIRKLKLAISYAAYLAKDAAILAEFFDQICKQFKVPAAPQNNKPLATSVPTSASVKTSVPATPQPTPAAIILTPTKIARLPTQTPTAKATELVFSQFKITDRIKLKNRTNIRSAPQIKADNLYGENLEQTAGIILEGPVRTSDDYGIITWWKVDFDNGFDGWCGENNFLSPAISPTVASGACGNIPNGGTTSRVQFLGSTPPCVSETQIGTCNNGQIIWTGTYSNPECGSPGGSDFLNMESSGNNKIYRPVFPGQPEIVFGNNIIGKKQVQVMLNGADPSEPVERANQILFNTTIDGYNFHSRCPTLSSCPGAIVNPEALLMLWGYNRRHKNILVKNTEVRNAAYFVNDGAHVDVFQSATIMSQPYTQQKIDMANGQEWFVIQDSILKNSDHNTMISETNYFKGVVYQNLKVTGVEPAFYEDCMQRRKSMGISGNCGDGNLRISAGYPWRFDNAPRTTWMINVTPPSQSAGSLEIESNNGQPQSSSNVWGPIILVGSDTKNYTIYTNFKVNDKWVKYVRNGPTDKVYRYNTIEEALAAGHARPPMIELSCSGWAVPPANCTSAIGPKIN